MLHWVVVGVGLGIGWLLKDFIIIGILLIGIICLIVIAFVIGIIINIVKSLSNFFIK